MVLIALGTVVVYHDYPFSMDEYAAVFQSKIFASGQIFAQLPRNLVDWLVVSGFNGSFLVASAESGRAIEYYWPGFALVLAPFDFLKVPWLCNASLAGLPKRLRAIDRPRVGQCCSRWLREGSWRTPYRTIRCRRT
jgi:hypothetical protein